MPWSLPLALALLAPAVSPCRTPAAPMVELFGEGLFSTGLDDAHVTFSPDGRTAWFLRDSPDFRHWTILATRCENGTWTAPEVAPFSGTDDDGDVFVTEDGSRILFVSNRPVDGRKRTDTEVWEMRRTDQGWSAPRHVDELSSPADEWFPTMTRDGWLYFGSDRPGGLGQTDIWRARWGGQRFGTPENLGAPVNSPGQEIEAFPDPDGRFLILSAKGRAGGAGDYDVFVTFPCANGWSEPRPLGAGVNSEGWEFGARVTPDGRDLYFTSNRSMFRRTPGERLDAATLSARLNAPGNGLRDIYRIAVSALDLEPRCETAESAQ